MQIFDIIRFIADCGTLPRGDPRTVEGRVLCRQPDLRPKTQIDETKRRRAPNG